MSSSPSSSRYHQPTSPPQPAGPVGGVISSQPEDFLDSLPLPTALPPPNPRKRRASGTNAAATQAPTTTTAVADPGGLGGGGGLLGEAPPVPAPAAPQQQPQQQAPPPQAQQPPSQPQQPQQQAAPQPPVKKSRTNTPWSPAEEQRLKTMRDAGSSWSEIAKTFPTRTEGSVKKHWYKDMHYAEFAEDESAALLAAIKEYEASKWKVIGQKVGKPAKACEQYAKEHFGGKV
ncbi:hypothetical protein L228DRAFT_237383 [Xylona heveae TC161]|uniref:Myb-like transcription factor n=1 Tax=Xylona heveae (strain CBS 132557 / TC161) TaxID=1328760 RepID=A0A161TQ72_XYLHT|nr:hypothetical protein L228DRAFT_237383 [Xylona heveae TC161]KZF24456.1 hypothetical protein L228DRAFT_237383 [Xylona heveae TC161]